MNKPLLTIAIPTWNRAQILDKALFAVLSQIENNKDNIEIIVSDNASNDNTDEIIKKHLEKFSALNIIHNTQSENTGYFGNFKKCRELSNGAYFWLLSDNDYIGNGLIDYLLNILKNVTPSFVFLKDWKHANEVSTKFNYSTNTYPVDKAIETFNYKTTLISAVIFQNDKINDKEIFNDFNGNTFLGFSLFLESLNKKQKAVEITGTSLYINDTKVSFNAFKSFALDLITCIKYATNKNILSEHTANIFFNKVISELTVKHYIAYRIMGKLHGQKHKKDTVDEMLNSGFSSYKAYKEELQPLQNANGFKFYWLVITKHLFRLIKERVLR